MVTDEKLRQIWRLMRPDLQTKQVLGHWAGRSSRLQPQVSGHTSLSFRWTLLGRPNAIPRRQDISLLDFDQCYYLGMAQMHGSNHQPVGFPLSHLDVPRNNQPSSSTQLSRLEAHLLQLLRVAEVELASIDGHWPQEILAGAWQGGGCLVPHALAEEMPELRRLAARSQHPGFD